MSNKVKDLASSASLLIELGTEELPPISLCHLAESFAVSIASSLSKIGLCDQKPKWLATPRRLTVLIPGVPLRQPNTISEKRGPALSAAFDVDGSPTKAALGFAKSCGVTLNKLKKIDDGNEMRLVFRARKAGTKASVLIPESINEAISNLPIAKRMRWGNGNAEFVRPVHWVVVMHGISNIPCQVLGVNSQTQSQGHRFLCEAPIQIKSADTYAETLKTQGFVIADLKERRTMIQRQIDALAKRVGAQPVVEDTLLNTVTGLVEWPHSVIGNFDPEFLKIPSEVLISSMKDHQKFFHLTNQQGELLPKFIAVSNIKSKKISRVRAGNERVLGARLSDAKFFWDEDRKTPLAEWVEQLGGISFHARLGTLYQKTQRIEKLSILIAKKLGWAQHRVARSALLCKADLASQMVNEFPELQGTMGYHYSRENGELKEVSIAIAEHYLPKHAGDKLPTSRAGKILALADRIDTLTGIFGAGEEPTGERDPYALRRAALGVIRILIEKRLPLNLVDLISLSYSTFTENDYDIDKTRASRILQFITDRYYNYFAASGYTKDEINSVLATGAVVPRDFAKRLDAISSFRSNPSATSLLEANKRISNILRKADINLLSGIDDTLFKHEAEGSLAKTLVEISTTISPLIQRGEYKKSLKQLAMLRKPVDRFFADVMVLTDDGPLRKNRLALLNQLGGLLNSVADLSKLQPKATKG